MTNSEPKFVLNADGLPVLVFTDAGGVIQTRQPHEVAESEVTK